MLRIYAHHHPRHHHRLAKHTTKTAPHQHSADAQSLNEIANVVCYAAAAERSNGISQTNTYEIRYVRLHDTVGQDPLVLLCRPGVASVIDGKSTTTTTTYHMQSSVL